MILELKTRDGRVVKARAHRVLKNTYPELELYIHHAISYETGELDRNLYQVSMKDGIGIGPRAFHSAERVLAARKAIIDKNGVSKVLETLDEYRKNPLSEKWRYGK